MQDDVRGFPRVSGKNSHYPEVSIIHLYPTSTACVVIVRHYAPSTYHNNGTNCARDDEAYVTVGQHMFEAKREAKREHIRNSNGKARRSRNMKEKKRGAYTGKISNQSLQRPMAQTATASR
jgi:hypothetical protein